MPAPRPSDPPRQHLRVGGHTVAFMDEGEGPVVLLLHGLPGTARDFRYLAPLLEGTRRVRVDLPGFGETDRRGKRAWTPEQRAGVVGELIDGLALDDVVVVGHSMGGVVATALAVQRPERVRGLGLLASPGVRPHRGFVGSNIRMLSRMLQVPGVPRLMRGQVRRGYVAAGFPRSTPDHEMVHALVDAGQLHFGRHAANLARVAVPTLVAFAEDDKLVEPAIGEGIIARVPEGPRLRWASGGHNIQKTQALELGAAVVAFTEALATGA